MPGRHRKNKPAPKQTAPKRIKRIHVLATVLLSTGVLASGLWYGLNKPLKTAIGANLSGKIHLPIHRENLQRKTFLLIGTDMRPGDTTGNTDVLLVLSIDRKHKRIELMSIPRDTQVAFPDGKYRKINESLNIGGPGMAMNLVQELLGIPIENYALTRFDGLVHIIDTIHGIQINVPKPMYYNTGDSMYGQIRLRKGLQILNGEQALGFVRYRRDALGDIGRTKRQQLFLTALSQKLLQQDNLRYLPTLVNDIWKSVDTDMSVMDVAALAAEAKEFKKYAIIHETLPGSFHDPVRGDPTDLSYWVVNPKQARYSAKRFFQDGVVQENPVQEPAVTQSWEVPENETARSTT